jgi:hypothetical protein
MLRHETRPDQQAEDYHDAVTVAMAVVMASGRTLLREHFIDCSAPSDSGCLT